MSRASSAAVVEAAGAWAAMAAGEAPATALPRAEVALLAAGFAAVDYLALADAATLRPLAAAVPGQPARLLAAARLDGVRLLDNMAAGA